MGRKLGGCRPTAVLRREAGSPRNIMSPEPRPISVSTGILIHPAVSPQQTWAKIGGCAPFGGEELGLNLTQRGEAYLHAKFHFDPSNRLTTIHQRHRQTGQDRQTDRQWCDSIGRTVLQTVAQKYNYRNNSDIFTVSDTPKLFSITFILRAQAPMVALNWRH